MRTVLTLAGTGLVRYLRDKGNLFFVFVFPLLLVLLIGVQFGGSASSGSAVLGGPESELRDRLAAALEDVGVAVRVGGDWDGALERVARGRADVALRLTAAGDLEAVVGSGGTAPLVRRHVTSAVAAMSLATAQEQALVGRGVGEGEARVALETARADVPAPQVEVVNVSEVAAAFAGLGRYDVGAVSQVVLFTFLITLTASAYLIQNRRLGVTARVLSTPVTSRTLVVGEALGKWVVGLFQAAYVMAATALLFDVEWGNLGLAFLVLGAFAAVAAGAAMMVGSLIDNEGAASGVSVGLGMVLGALGGGMAPLEVFSDTVRSIANVTPHAWAYTALTEIQRRDAGLVDILPQLGVLTAMAAVLLILGGVAMRRSVARAM